MYDFLNWCAAHPGAAVPDPIVKGLVGEVVSSFISLLCYAFGVAVGTAAEKRKQELPKSEH